VVEWEDERIGWEEKNMSMSGVLYSVQSCRSKLEGTRIWDNTPL
jgi:hypothetical protein